MNVGKRQMFWSLFFFPAKPELEFDNKFRDVITLNTGTSLRIPVTYSGLPKPTITWGKDEKALKAGGSVTIDTKDTLTTLQVKKVTRADDGLYFITAENEAGKIKATFDVEVIGKDWVLGQEDWVFFNCTNILRNSNSLIKKSTLYCMCTFFLQQMCLTSQKAPSRSAT